MRYGHYGNAASSVCLWWSIDCGLVDVADRQWECEGELIPLDSSALSPGEFLVYQHGRFLMHMLRARELVCTGRVGRWSLTDPFLEEVSS